MSGIFGIYHFDGRPVDAAILAKMSEKLAHRGKDGESIWHKGSVGLGHRMLWTTPESLEEQLPLISRNGQFVVTSDARIDNRNEIITSLNITDRQPSEITDAELILAAYEKWDERCPDRLLGDFTFAIWDDRKQKIFCSRDHFGIKPFYYYLSDRVFAFASEIKALLCLPEVPCRLNEMRILEHLASFFDDTSITFYEDIFRLPPAHSITVSCDKADLQCYWTLDPSRELRLGSNKEYAEAFREIFTEAVHSRLRSAFPVGSNLSGGMDSSSISCVARDVLSQTNGEPLHTFSRIFNQVTQCDERPYIEAVVAQGGIEPHYVHGDVSGPLFDLDHVHWHLDEANFAGNLFMIWAVNNSVKEQGVRVLLDGFDGDTTVSHGIGYLTELARSRRWISLTRETRAYSRHFNVSPWRWVWFYIFHHGLGTRIPRVIGSMEQRLLRFFSGRKCTVNRSVWDFLLVPEFAQRMRLKEHRQRLSSSHKGLPLTERESHYRLITRGLMPHMLEIHDKASAAFSIEKRFPFFDKRLVEFCLSLPPDQKLYRGWNRMVLRRALNNVLPKKVQWRGGKTDMNPNFVRGLLTFDRERLERMIFEDLNIIEKYVDTFAVRKEYRRLISRKSDQYKVASLWRVLSLSLWLQYTGLRHK